MTSGAGWLWRQSSALLLALLLLRHVWLCQVPQVLAFACALALAVAMEQSPLGWTVRLSQPLAEGPAVSLCT